MGRRTIRIGFVFACAWACAAWAGVPRSRGESRDQSSDPRSHWAFLPIRDPKPPEVRHGDWVRTPIDRFVLLELERRGLRPSLPAPRRDWLRRVTFDLVGLPPTPEEIDAFERDAAPDAFERVVERLLASAHYGERWGRWWLDVARYADTNGQDENKVMANAWRYRDWVIRAFDRNLPFDQFIVDQLAGDLLPASGSESDRHDRLVATGFLVLGPKMLAEQDKPKLVMDLVDEQIDTAGRAFLGLTLGCARCHDHKYDPIPMRDYYAMAGVFKSTRTMENLAFVSKVNERSVASADQVLAWEEHRARVAALTNRLAAVIRQANAALLETWKPDGPRELPKDPRPHYPAEVRDELSELECANVACLAEAPPPLEQALAVADDKVVDLPVYLRGNHLKPSDQTVPRGFLQVVAPTSPPVPAEHSGRLEFARWLVAPENPLTARVIVNRVWQAYFGEGLVRTPDNFGFRGEAPSHPDLLDWMATEFVRSGWDLRHLHRLVVRSAVYRQAARGARSGVIASPNSLASSDADAGSGSGSRASEPDSRETRDEDALIDSENRFLAWFPRRRLEAEMIRDAVLRACGRLDTTSGGTLVNWKNDEYAPADDVSATALRRTVYLPIVRDRVYDALTLFDFANPSVITAKRVPTVVAQQALFFMNSAIVRDSARAMAEELSKDGRLDLAGRVTEAYRRVLGRVPSEAEQRRSLRFLEAGRVGLGETSDRDGNEAALGALADLCQSLLASNEFVYRP